MQTMLIQELAILKQIRAVPRQKITKQVHRAHTGLVRCAAPFQAPRRPGTHPGRSERWRMTAPGLGSFCALAMHRLGTAIA